MMSAVVFGAWHTSRNFCRAFAMEKPTARDGAFVAAAAGGVTEASASAAAASSTDDSAGLPAACAAAAARAEVRSPKMLASRSVTTSSLCIGYIR